jgi:hypothetical protein
MAMKAEADKKATKKEKQVRRPMEGGGIEGDA